MGAQITFTPSIALWFAAWAKLGARWVAAARTAPREYVVPTREALLRLLWPTSFPPVIPTEAGHVLTAVDSINPFWTLFAASNEVMMVGGLGPLSSDSVSTQTGSSRIPLSQL